MSLQTEALVCKHLSLYSLYHHILLCLTSLYLSNKGHYRIKVLNLRVHLYLRRHLVMDVCIAV